MAFSAPSAYTACAFVVTHPDHAFVVTETFSAMEPMTTIVEPIMTTTTV